MKKPEGRSSSSIAEAEGLAVATQQPAKTIRRRDILWDTMEISGIGRIQFLAELENAIKAAFGWRNTIRLGRTIIDPLNPGTRTLN